jgi:hypothetical protein
MLRRLRVRCSWHEEFHPPGRQARPVPHHLIEKRAQIVDRRVDVDQKAVPDKVSARGLKRVGVTRVFKTSMRTNADTQICPSQQCRGLPEAQRPAIVLRQPRHESPPSVGLSRHAKCRLARSRQPSARWTEVAFTADYRFSDLLRKRCPCIRSGEGEHLLKIRRSWSG